jgi:holdfast attachment protein HfaA
LLNGKGWLGEPPMALTKTVLAGGGVMIALVAVSGAHAQSASSTASQYSHGYGAGGSAFEQPVNVSTRDANGNMTIVNGVMQGVEGTIFANAAGASTATTGAGSSATGSGVGSATAIGNNLVVVTQGNYNTVVVNATQTNTGAVSATTQVLNGKVDLNGGP